MKYRFCEVLFNYVWVMIHTYIGNEAVFETTFIPHEEYGVETREYQMETMELKQENIKLK